MATPIKSLFPPIEKKPFLLNKQKSGSRRPTSCIDSWHAGVQFQLIQGQNFLKKRRRRNFLE